MSALPRVLERFDRWVLEELPSANRDVLAGRATPEDLAASANRRLRQLPEPGELSTREACRALVSLGIVGSSVGRHMQERDLRLKRTPEASLAELAVSSTAAPFTDYVTRLAASTGTGHPPRDAYASLVRWNAPEVTVRWQEAAIATLPSMFDDGQTRTYTGHGGEKTFFRLLKLAEALELAANVQLDLLSGSDVDLTALEATAAMVRAAALIDAVQRESDAEFHAGAPEDHLDSDHFLDVLRQFTVHWRAGDLPPSGAQDPEFLKRDLLLGIDYPDYPGHIRRVFTMLLQSERDELERLFDATPLPIRLLRAVGITPDELAGTPVAGLRQLVRSVPSVAACYLLLRANAGVASWHLAVTKRLMFDPMRERAQNGIPDRELVSNWVGTTGLVEANLEQLAAARQRHPLTPLAAIGDDEIASLTALHLVADAPIQALISDGRGVGRGERQFGRIAGAG
jgi:hypothetical protein